MPLRWLRSSSSSRPRCSTVLLARLARLGDAAQRIAAAVAVFGDGAALRHAIALSGLAPLEAEQAADALTAAGILAPEQPLRFLHPLIATAVYSDLPLFARARTHRNAARILSTDGAPTQAIAAHLRLASPESDPWAVDVLRAAARGDLERGDPSAAARLLERALAEPPPPEQRCDVLLELAGAEAMNVEVSAQIHAKQALEQAHPDSRPQALRAVARISLLAGDHETGAEALREILDETAARDPAAERILGSTSPSADSRRRCIRRLLDASRRSSTPLAAVHRLLDPGNLNWLTSCSTSHSETGSPRRCSRWPSGQLRSTRSLILPLMRCPMGILVQALCCIDQLKLAESAADAALLAARQRGAFLAAASIASYHRAIPRYHRGALADALADLDQAQAPRREGWTAGA